MKLTPKTNGEDTWGWNSDDAAAIYWYKSDWPGSDKSPTPPETITAHVIGHTGIVMSSKMTIKLEQLRFLGAGLFGKPRGDRTKWTGDSYRYGIYAIDGDYLKHHCIIRMDGGGIYAYVDCGHTDWPALCQTLPTERLWDLCQVIGHTYEQGVEHERKRLYRLVAENRLKRAKVRGQNAYKVTEIAKEEAEKEVACA